MKVISFPNAFTVKITTEQAKSFGLIVNAESTPDQVRGKLKTFGAWQIPVSYKALRVSGLKPNDLVVYGPGTLDKVKNLGYDLEGRVRVAGKRVRGFTSTQFFMLPCGHSIEVAVIHCCLDQPK